MRRSSGLPCDAHALRLLRALMFSKPLGRDLPTPLHKIDCDEHILLCLAGVRDGKPQYVPHGHPDDLCGR